MGSSLEAILPQLRYVGTKKIKRIRKTLKWQEQIDFFGALFTSNCHYFEAEESHVFNTLRSCNFLWYCKFYFLSSTRYFCSYAIFYIYLYILKGWFFFLIPLQSPISLNNVAVRWLMTRLTFTFSWKGCRLHLSSVPKHVPHSPTAQFGDSSCIPINFLQFITHFKYWLFKVEHFCATTLCTCCSLMNISNPIALWSLNLISLPASILFIIQVLLHFLGLYSKYPLRYFCFLLAYLYKRKQSFATTCIFSQALNNSYSSQTWSNWNPLWSVLHPFNESPQVHKYFFIFLLTLSWITCLWPYLSPFPVFSLQYLFFSYSLS